MKARQKGNLAFTLVEVMIVVAIVGLLAAIAIPNFVRARNTTQKEGCVSHLRQIDRAKQQWALEFKKSGADTPTTDEVRYYIKNNQYPTCPANGSYTVNNVSTDPTCSRSADGHAIP